MKEGKPECKKLGCEFSGLHVQESKPDNYGLVYGGFVPLLMKVVQEQIFENGEFENGECCFKSTIWD